MVDPAWATARLSYAGWVPNVGSHLSFSLIGSRAGKGVVRLSARVEHSDPIARVVCALQTRTTDDMLLPPKLARRGKPDLQQHWMLIGETEVIEVPTGIEPAKPKRLTLTQRLRRPVEPAPPPVEKITTARDEQGALVGRVLILPYEEDSEARAKQQKLLADVRARLSSAAQGSDSQVAIRDAEARIRGSEAALVTVNFALMRTGEARLWFHQEYPEFNDDEHRQIARQAYFFLKDMSHRHVHHDKLDDQITPLIRFKNGTAEQRLKSEVEWRRETLWSLSRLADKRMGSEKLNSLREALGMLAYADAFQKTLLPHVRDPENPLAYLPNKSAHGYDYQHIRESTRVRIDQTAARRTVTGQLVAAVFAGAIASLSLVSALVATHNAGIAAGEPGKFKVAIWPWLLEAMGSYPLVVMAVSAYILYAAFALMLSDIVFTQPRRRFQLLRGLTLSIAHKRKLNAEQTFRLLMGIYIGLLVALLGITGYLIYVISSQPPDLGLGELAALLGRLAARIPIY
jgi:hypothetical protein